MESNFLCFIQTASPLRLNISLNAVRPTTADAAPPRSEAVVRPPDPRKIIGLTIKTDTNGNKHVNSSVEEIIALRAAGFTTEDINSLIQTAQSSNPESTKISDKPIDEITRVDANLVLNRIKLLPANTANYRHSTSNPHNKNYFRY